MAKWNYSKKKMMDPKSKGPVRSLIDREPVWRKVEKRVDKTASEIRNKPGNVMREHFPTMQNRNIGGGVVVGAVGAAIVKVIKDYVPLDSDVTLVNSKQHQNGTVYTVNVDSPFGNVAQAEAFFEATTGFTSLLTDNVNVSSAKVLKTRVLRDTYEVEILVEH